MKNWPENQYFKKESNGEWIEYQDGSEREKFDELSRINTYNGPVVVLRNKFKHWFVKLTPNEMFQGDSEYSLESRGITGKWKTSDTYISVATTTYNYPTLTSKHTTSSTEIEGPLGLLKKPEIIIGFSVFSILFLIFVLVIVVLFVKRQPKSIIVRQRESKKRLRNRKSFQDEDIEMVLNNYLNNTGNKNLIKK